MARVIVPAASVKYVNVNPAVDPAVTAAAVISTVPGAHTAAGALVITVGAAFIVTVTAVGAEAHPQLLFQRYNMFRHPLRSVWQE